MATELTPASVFETTEEHYDDEGHLKAVVHEGPQDDIVLERHFGDGSPTGGVCVRIGARELPQTLVYHSPGGFEWNYGGSGPADLALNILALWVDPPIAWVLHQEFKWTFLAGMPREGGILKRDVVRRWIETTVQDRRIEPKPF